jgi:hypothetical protein
LSEVTTVLAKTVIEIGLASLPGIVCLVVIGRRSATVKDSVLFNNILDTSLTTAGKADLDIIGKLIADVFLCNLSANKTGSELDKDWLVILIPLTAGAILAITKDTGPRLNCLAVLGIITDKTLPNDVLRGRTNSLARRVPKESAAVL